MPPQTRAAQGFAGVAVEIDLTHKGIKTVGSAIFHGREAECRNRPDSQRD